MKTQSFFRNTLNAYDTTKNLRFRNPTLYNDLNQMVERCENLYSKYHTDGIDNIEVKNESDRLFQEEFNNEIDNFYQSAFNSDPRGSLLTEQLQNLINDLSSELQKPDFSNLDPSKAALLTALFTSDHIVSMMDNNPSEDDPLEIRDKERLKSIIDEINQLEKDAEEVSNSLDSSIEPLVEEPFENESLNPDSVNSQDKTIDDGIESINNEQSPDKVENNSPDLIETNPNSSDNLAETSEETPTIDNTAQPEIMQQPDSIPVSEPLPEPIFESLPEPMNIPEPPTPEPPPM